ncbi:MAG: metallophosphoesterase [Verrucomicrobiota bacterium JB022]|nr:metallophosphoesterase [Verrucomicrobiota bacterium JB022]
MTRTSLLSLTLLASLTGQLSAERYVFDFGLANEESARPDLFGTYWNNFSDRTATSATGFVDMEGNPAEGLTVTFTDAFPASSSNTIGTEKVYTPSATGDFWYVTKGSADTSGAFVIGGLDPSGNTVYDLQFFASTNRRAPQVFDTDYAVAGATSETTTLVIVGNESNVARVDGMVPNASGEITVTVTASATSDSFGAIGVFDLASRAPGDPVTPAPEEPQMPDPSAIGSTPNPSADPSDANPHGLRAYVWESVDSYTSRVGLGELLRRAGFHVEPLPLDAPPFDGERETDVDLIALGSFVSESPAYAAYMAEYGDMLDDYIDRRGLLIQFTQNDSIEVEPPFLPSTQDASRSDADFDAPLILTPEHPLLAGVPTVNEGKAVSWIMDNNPSHPHYPDAGWEAFVQFFGFQVLLSGDERARNPILMEGAYGQGRFFLAAMGNDKVLSASSGQQVAPESLAAFNDVFFANLYEYAKLVTDLNTPALDITPQPGESEIDEGAWTIAILPDTQIYSQNYPGVFSAQTSWLVANRQRYNIRYVLHLGDIVNVNSIPEWQNARESLGILDGKLPYALVPGNHDYGPGGNARTRATFLNDYFHTEFYEQWPTFGGAMNEGEMDNTYHLFRAGGIDWIVIALEWGPRDSTIEWADSILERYPNRKAILVTHAYMNNNDYRYDITDTERPQDYNPHVYNTEGGVNDGEELWQKLVKRHNFVLTVNGHVLGDGAGFRIDPNDAGQNVAQMLVNYQMRSLGGEGYLRLLTINPDSSVDVKSYSPIYDSYLTAQDQEFSFDLAIEPEDLNENGVPDYFDAELDSDMDGLNNYEEFVNLGTNPMMLDSDGDGLSDAFEVEHGLDPATSDAHLIGTIFGHANQLGYYTAEDIHNLKPGSLVVEPENGGLRLQFQLQESADLEQWNDLGEPIEATVPAPSGASFYRFAIEE